MNDAYADITEGAKQVLDDNFRGSHTIPAGSGLYPHQWLWDSCFIAIGLSRYDIERAKTEILSLLDGQWHNGMMPNTILNNQYSGRDGRIWRSWLNPNAPDHVQTSGITQPPVLAEAIVRIGKQMKLPERRTWYKQTFPGLLAYHQWMYNDRDPHKEGLVLQVHPWETGLDNTPPWMQQLHEHQLALWIRVVRKLNLGPVVNIFRRDTKLIPAEQRLDIIDALALYSTQRRLRRKNYDTDKIISHSLFAIEDVSFNAILLRANQHVQSIAKTIGTPIAPSLLECMERTKNAFEQLWDPYSMQYYSREFTSHKLLKIPSIGGLIALYSGTIPKDKAKILVGLLEDTYHYGANFPVPSTSLGSEWFKPTGYWQGPSWVNTNWLIIDGLERYGFNEHADALRESTLAMIKQSGFYEYFNPLDGNGAGAANFSWTAALAIDLAYKK